MKKSLSLRLFSSLAVFAPLVSSQSDCWDQENAVFNKTYTVSGSSSQNCTALIEATLRLNSYRYSSGELGALIQALTNESLQTSGFNSSNELVGSLVQENFNFGCMSVENFPVFFNLSISLFAVDQVGIQACTRAYQSSSLPKLQSGLAEELANLARRENQEQARATLYIFLALSAAALLVFSCLALCLRSPRRRTQAVSRLSGYGTFVQLGELAQPDQRDLGTDDTAYELPSNYV